MQIVYADMTLKKVGHCEFIVSNERCALPYMKIDCCV